MTKILIPLKIIAHLSSKKPFQINLAKQYHPSDPQTPSIFPNDPNKNKANLTQATFSDNNC